MLSEDPPEGGRASLESDGRSGLLLEINNAVVSSLDLAELLKRISSCLRRIVRHSSAVLLLHDAEMNRLRAYALDSSSNADKPTPGYLLKIDGTPSGEAFDTGRTLTFSRDDLSRYPNTLMLSMEHTWGTRSGCSVPLVSKGRKLGVLTLLSDDEESFQTADIALIEEAVSQIAIAVENAINYEAALRERNRFEMLHEVSTALSSVLNLRDVLKIVSGILRRNIRHEYAGIGLYDPESQQFQILTVENLLENLHQQGTAFPSAGTPADLAFRTRQIVMRPRINHSEFPSPYMKAVSEAGFSSFCIVPLIARDKAVGVLAIANTKEDSFTSSDCQTLQLIANQIAGAIETAVQYEEIEKLKDLLASEKLYLEEEIQSQYNFEEIVGRSRALKEVLQQIETVAPTDSCVLLCGETGTGKELFSRAIHNLSSRKERTLVKLNCAAIPTGLLESELFGHEKGAFTSAVGSRVGRFELADKGTLLLDEIGDIPSELQPKLLRVIQENEFERLGSSRTIKTDVRLIAATHRNLRAMVDERTFRSDLYYRLNVFPIRIPPLRERREDIPLLAAHFTQKHSRRMSKTIDSIPRETVDALCDYDFPGNVRELENFIERAVILTRGRELHMPIAEFSGVGMSSPGSTTKLPLHEVERLHIAEVLKSLGGQIAGKGGAAEVLNMPASTLRHRMKKLGLK
jgi:formate hydrogenlyase transcriptional activator